MKFIILLFLSSSILGLNAQDIQFSSSDFYVFGHASLRDDTTFILTDNLLYQTGSIWYRDDIDLSESFHIELELFFGCSDGGADGIAFILHPEISIGSECEGMGVGGLTPSFSIEMDTYQNFRLKDAHFDHGALMANGASHHKLSLTEPVPLIPKKKNVENCTFYPVIFDWDHSTQIFTFTFNGIERIRRQIDMVSLIFKDNTNVFWGLGSATGLKRNKHLVRIRNLKFTPNETLSTENQTFLLNGETLILEDIDFDVGSGILPESAKPILDKLIRFHAEHPKYTLILDSYAKSKDEKSDHKELAKDRAEAIAKHMIAKGFPKNKISYFGNREFKSSDPDNMESGESTSPRIELRMKLIKA